MNYIVYGNRHRFCNNLKLACHQKGFSKDLADFCTSRKLLQSDGVACAYDAGALVGFFRFDIDGVDGTIYTNGTYVAPDYRGEGIAYNLWIRVLNKMKPEKVVAIVTSRGGENLVQKMKKFFTNIKFSESSQI